MTRLADLVGPDNSYSVAGAAAWSAARAKHLEVVSLGDFRIVGDGSDETALIWEAFDYCISNARALYVPTPISYYSIRDMILISGAGPGSVLRVFGEGVSRGPTGSHFRWDGAPGGTVFKFVGLNSVHFEDWGIDGKDSADRLLWFENAAGEGSASELHLDNMKFSSTRRTTKSVGVQFGSSNYQVSEVRISKSLFQSCYYGMLSFTSNVKNFVVRDGGCAYCYWGLCFGDPDASTSLSGHNVVQGMAFGACGEVAGGFFNGVAGGKYQGGDIHMGFGTVIGCESEGSSRFVNTGTAGSIGLNPSSVTLISNVASGMAPPADDYVCRFAGGAILIGNRFENNRTAGAIAKIQMLGAANYGTDALRYTQVSQPCISLGNFYQGADTYPPIHDGSNNLLTFNNGYPVTVEMPVISFGDQGLQSYPSASPAIANLRPILLDMSTALGTLPEASASTSTARYHGKLTAGMNKITVSFEELIDASTVHRCTVFDIPSKTKVTSIIADVTEAFAGLAGTITMMLGDGSATEYEFLLEKDVKTAPITIGMDDAELGAYLAAASNAQGGYYNWGSTNIMRARFTSGSGNFGDGAVTNLTAGSVDFYVYVERMP